MVKVVTVSSDPRLPLSMSLLYLFLDSWLRTKPVCGLFKRWLITTLSLTLQLLDGCDLHELDRVWWLPHLRFHYTRLPPAQWNTMFCLKGQMKREMVTKK